MVNQCTFLDQQISLIIQRRLMDAFEDFQKDILTTCELEEAAGTLPLQVRFFSAFFILFVIIVIYKFH